MVAVVTVVAGVAAGAGVPALADGRGGSVAVRGPDAGITAKVDFGAADGSVSLSVQRDGRELILPSPLGLRTERVDLTRGLRLVSQSQRAVTERYRMTTGKRLDRVARLTETRFSLRGNGDAAVDLVLRVAEDGVAYRYVLPGEEIVLGEASAFTLPADSPAWLMPYNPQHENRRQRTTAGGAPAGIFGNPSLFQVGADYVLLTEAGVDGRYAGSRLAHAAGSGTYAVELADQRVRLGAGTPTPWRTAIIGDLGKVTESTLVDDLADPARFSDTSWIKPGKVAWSWLSEHSSPSNFARQKEYVDFAARNGWPYVLVDEGWSPQWVPELTRYARARNVDILLWYHWQRLDTQQERDTEFAKVTGWGVKGVKIDFMESDSQSRYQWYDQALADTARHRLMVNFHGSTIPHGLARTWPHVMTMEAVHGAEQLPQPTDNPVHPFARNVVGSMDFTPVSLEVGPRTSTIAHEIALPVVFESGWQHFADKPEAYQRFPRALRFLDQVPTVWEETRFRSGYPGQDAVLARRSGDRWFFGGIATGDPATLTAGLDVLGPGRWLVEVVRDAPGGRGDVLVDSAVRSSRDRLSVDVPRNGGFAAIACPATAGRTTCHQPVPQPPLTRLTITPTDAGDVLAGNSFEVTAEFTVDSARTLREVELRASAPAGFTVSGPAVTAARLGQGGQLRGRWRVTVGAEAKFGPVELPVFAEFTDPALPPGRQRMHVGQAVKAAVALTGQPWVSELPFTAESNGWGPVERDRSNNDSAGGDGNPLRINGISYAKGLGAHAPSEVSVHLGGRCTRFTALAGLDDETTSPGSAAFHVLTDGLLRQETGVLRTGQAATPLSVDLTGARTLTLRVSDGGDGRNFDHADWAEARLTC
ncbi:glycoside hydrolase family 97 catalytic domain-containing protein [Crossiella cryophila]|uniref:Glycosyl hydrolase family 98 putative carbohydrate-binding module domain-containing protein n=1 Tax=Crossiella cryophila TaxID=43355 RepID=A0A7W7FVG6_9PSEU|nr:glycoside hydrolase family 97 catalytic domain-containing protein [Crossiella cryophila]MBB4676839.1 hypothetical protein [Crossiella cryophila]